MTRQATLLLVLIGLLLAAGYWFLVYQPGAEELAEVETQITDVQAQQVTTQQRISQLESVRAEAPAIEAAIAAAQGLVPADTALPATLRQLQAAADDAGVELLSLSPGTPAAATVPQGVTAPEDLTQLSLTLNVEGSYFQVVDLLRRIESPELVARGIVVDAVSLAPGDYPTLTVSISARMFSALAPPPVPEPDTPEPTETPSDGATETPSDGATDAEEAAA
jgi:type IV pilus assembly protein PilO